MAFLSLASPIHCNPPFSSFPPLSLRVKTSFDVVSPTRLRRPPFSKLACDAFVHAFLNVVDAFDARYLGLIELIRIDEAQSANRKTGWEIVDVPQPTPQRPFDSANVLDSIGRMECEPAVTPDRSMTLWLANATQHHTE